MHRWAEAPHMHRIKPVYSEKYGRLYVVIRKRRWADRYTAKQRLQSLNKEFEIKERYLREDY